MVCYSLNGKTLEVPDALCTVELLGALSDVGFVTSSQERGEVTLVVHPQYWVRLHHRRARSGLSLKNWIKQSGLPPYEVGPSLLRVETDDIDKEFNVSLPFFSWPRVHSTVCLSTATMIRCAYPEVSSVYKGLDPADML